MTLYKHPQGQSNYRNSFEEIVDRFGWEGGCIVEHVGFDRLGFESLANIVVAGRRGGLAKVLWSNRNE